MSDDQNEFEHPALKDFNEPIETVKHVAGKTVKGGLIGGVVGGAGLLAATAAFAALTPAGWVATAGTAILETLGVIEIGGVVGATTAVATTGAAIGGIAGAGIGGAMGISNAGEAIEDKKETIVAQAERMEVRKERAQAMQIQKNAAIAAANAQGQQMGVVPPQGLPPRGQNGQNLA